MRDSGPDIEHFLTRLGLRGDTPADARSIRRAYARELKQIDQERDAAGFQALRLAYETALSWVEQQAAQGGTPAVEAPQAVSLDKSDMAAAPTEPSPDFGLPRVPVHLGAPAPQPVNEAPGGGSASEQVDPRAWADEVFGRLLVRCATLLQGDLGRDAKAWQAEITRCLADPLLFNMAARSLFEARIVDLLAQGWQHGNETLLVAATTAFDWSGDRRRMQRFGRAGALIDHAIDERLVFDAQPEGERAAQRALINRMREARLPTMEELRRDRFHFERLTARYPAMMVLLVGEANLERWGGPYRQMPRSTAFMIDESVVARASAPAKSRWTWGGRAMAAFFVINLLRLLFNAVATPDVPDYPPAINGAPPSVLVGPSGLPLSAASIREIDERIGYTPLYPKVGDQRRVEYQVYLNEAYKVILVNKTVASGDRQFDEAVGRAIRASAPFPHGTARVFKLSFPISVTGTGSWSHG